ncbi:HesB/YadR/YfhF family protein [Alteribacillus sp. HJP-4]|uniref:HesB/YadR/YfhF family protein n=1 Tax=Alteribacillus sp. HJP-4 TaxID=2775394 RepID=UPI0035CCE26D
MNITVTQPAIKWFQEEMNASNGDAIRFFARYGGHSQIQSGFSLGLSKTKPAEIGASADIEGITFFVEEKDLWYFKDHHLHVKYSRKSKEIEFDYKELEESE